MIRNNIIQFPVYHTVTYILSAFSVQKHIILSAFSNKTGCKVTEILLMMQIKLHKFSNKRLLLLIESKYNLFQSPYAWRNILNNHTL